VEDGTSRLLSAFFPAAAPDVVAFLLDVVQESLRGNLDIPLHPASFPITTPRADVMAKLQSSLWLPPASSLEVGAAAEEKAAQDDLPNNVKHDGENWVVSRHYLLRVWASHGVRHAIDTRDVRALADMLSASSGPLAPRHIPPPSDDSSTPATEACTAPAGGLGAASLLRRALGAIGELPPGCPLLATGAGQEAGNAKDFVHAIVRTSLVSLRSINSAVTLVRDGAVALRRDSAGAASANTTNTAGGTG
jgi:hypothetical protein